MAVTTGWSAGVASFDPHATAAATPAEPHSLARYGTGRPVRPMRAFNVARSSSISTQPAIPADAVRPAAPHAGGSPSHRGSGIAHTYPSTVVSTTRTIA